MTIYEDHCVGCPPEIGCFGDLCQYKNVPVCICDECEDYAAYTYYGEEYCDSCMRKILIKEFSNLSTTEMLEAMDAEWDRAGEI